MARPPKYKTPQELEKKIKSFFDNPPDTKPVYNKEGNKIADIPVLTITGLVLYCGFCSRQSFYAYEAKKEFSYIIKKARTMIEKEYEILLQKGLGAGAIFALKNFGWTDKQEEQSDDRLTEELEFVGVPTSEVNGRFKRFYN